MRNVEFESLGLQQPACLDGFLAPAFAEVDVGPAGESILFVPGAFPVPQQYQPKHESLVTFFQRRIFRLLASVRRHLPDR